jgi:hypothetical protein
MTTSTWRFGVRGFAMESNRKNGTDQHDEDQQQTKKGLTIGHLECTITVYRPGSLRITINELGKYKIAIKPQSKKQVE